MSAHQFLIKLILITVFFLLNVKNGYTNNIDNLGIIGETYPIMEIDFLDYLYSRIELMQKNGEWKSIQNHAKQSAINYRDRPTKVEGMTRTAINKSWKYDPSIVLDHDVKTPDGKLIAKQGAVVNPLIYMPLTKTLIFYNSDDQDQVKWAIQLDKKLNGKDKLILVNGSVLEQEKIFKKVIYFDQAGKLISRFGITHVPAIVMQENLHLKIMEIVP
jgi:conjugal transfer pilus assembly protein TraW